MNTKSEKTLFSRDQPTLPVAGIVNGSSRRSRPTRFRRFLAHVGFALALFWLYNTYVLNNAQNMTNWKHSCSKVKRSFDNYVKRVEDAFLAVPSTESAIANSRHYTAHPHLAGSPEDFQDAKDVLLFFQQEFGITSSSVQPVFEAGSAESREATLSITSKLKHPKAWIDVYYPVMNTGNTDGISLEILGEEGETLWTANLAEDGDPGDETAAKYKDAIPPWHGFSAAGEAAGQIVYANYGTKEDYDELVVAGVDLTGKIVLARYGKIFRGLKVQGAEERGAAGVLIYTDSSDDGDVVTENGYLPYPAGPARNPTSIQRGSVLYLSVYPGDPTTPGYPSYENATRTEGENIPHIPSLPLSWANAKYLFEQELGGVEEGEKLDGKLGTHVIKMVNDVDTKVIPIWNTMVAIPGHIKDEVVVVGCHRDAWVMGAADPISGTTSILEVVRGLGALVKRGWKPLRTIVVASWDAEEYGLVGSTEWGEDFADWIQAHVVSYINADDTVTGSRYSPSGSPSLAHLIMRIAQEIPHPTEANKTVWDAVYDFGPFVGEEDASLNETRALDTVDDVRKVTPLGSGSDYTVFLQRLGIASSNQVFGKTHGDAPYHYHSIYDSQMWQEKYGDPGFHRNVAIAKALGLLTLRLSDSIILPLNTTEYSLQLDSYLDKVERLAVGLATIPKLHGLREAISKLQLVSAELDIEKAEAENALREAFKKIARKRFPRRIIRRIKDWIKRHVGKKSSASKVEQDDEAFQFHALNKLSEIQNGDVDEQEICKSRKGALCNLIRAARRVKNVNRKLKHFELGFIEEEGVKDREWYRHLGVAPGKYLGYGATTLPALTEAIKYEQNKTLIEYEVVRLTTVLSKLAEDIKP